MYQKGYGIIETLAPLHVGASAGEETGNLNLIFRDQFTLTGIIPGSSIRGRFRADMRVKDGDYASWYGKDTRNKNGSTSEDEQSTTEGIVKFEYASLLWIPIYCPAQPIVRVSCPSLLRRYQKLKGLPAHEFKPYSYYKPKKAKKVKRDRLFFNLGFLPLKESDAELDRYLPDEIDEREDYLLLVVKDTEISMIHDMGLYRQSRVALKENEKIVDGKGFFNVEALPERTILVFPIALKETQEKPEVWKKYLQEIQLDTDNELYFGGLESVGFGRTKVIVKQASSKEKKNGTSNPT